MNEGGVDVRRGDVVIVRLHPAEGHELAKTRPAVVLQNDVGNEHSSTTIVVPATGTYRGFPFEVLIDESNSPFEKDSSIRLDQIHVVSRDRRRHSVVGTLDDETMAEVDEAVRLSLGLD